MSENGALTAIARIERALARIEAAASRPPQTPGSEIALAEMTSRHEALRTEARQALVELDRLIGEHG